MVYSGAPSLPELFCSESNTPPVEVFGGEEGPRIVSNDGRENPFRRFDRRFRNFRDAGRFFGNRSDSYRSQSTSWIDSEGNGRSDFVGGRSDFVGGRSDFVGGRSGALWKFITPEIGRFPCINVNKKPWGGSHPPLDI